MSRPVKVLFVDETFTFGGAITSLSHLVHGLADYDIDVTVVSGQDEATLSTLFPRSRHYSVPLRLPWIHADPFAREQGAGTDVVKRLGPLTRVARSMYWFANGDLRSSMRIAQLARRHRADIIHLNNGWQLDGAMAAKVLGVACVAHLRGFWTADPDADRPPTLVGLGQRAMHALRHNIAPPLVTLPVSGSVAESVEQQGVPADRITVVHDAIDLETFHPGPPPEGLRAEIGVPDDALLVGHFGRVIPWKGTIEFLRGFARVAAEVPSVHALVVGDASDGPVRYQQQVHESACELGIAERVTFTGFRADVPDVMRLCDVVVHSSTDSEPFGMVIVEGMATGNAVVAADSGGPVEIIRDGIDGYLVDPRDPAKMSDRIKALVTDDDLRKRIATAGMKRTQSHFSKERYAADVVSVYERVLGLEIARRSDRGAVR
jgi:glycosyltransferase involved in cell wall biosynthesis